MKRQIQDDKIKILIATRKSYSNILTLGNMFHTTTYELRPQFSLFFNIERGMDYSTEY